MEANLTYETAYKELAQIAKEIENETVSVDVLAQKVKRLKSYIFGGIHQPSSSFI